MKFLFDQNLSFRLVSALAQSFPGSVHIRDVGLAAAADKAIWDYARQHGFVIVSKDSDFFHRSILLGHPPKAVWIRLGNCTTAQIIALLQARHHDLLLFDADPQVSFLALA